MIIKGTLVTGLGESKFFMRKEDYQEEFQKKLGYNPWPGTFNIKLKETTTEILDKLKPIIIKGFKENNKTFGSIKCYPCVIEKHIKTHLIIPEKTKFDNTIVEIISPVYLRQALNITDNNEVTIELK